MSQILFEKHTYMKNYSSFAENSNLMGPLGFLLAVFGNCAPRPHGSQTLEGEKRNKPPCVCRLRGIFQTSIYRFLSGFYLIPERSGAGTFILINHARETQAQTMEWQTQRSEAHSKAQRWPQKLTTWGIVQMTPSSPTHPEGFCFG